MSSPRPEWETWPMFRPLLPGESVLYCDVDAELVLPMQQWLEYERGLTAYVRSGRRSILAVKAPKVVS